MCPWIGCRRNKGGPSLRTSSGAVRCDKPHYLCTFLKPELHITYILQEVITNNTDAHSCLINSWYARPFADVGLSRPCSPFSPYNRRPSLSEPPRISRVALISPAESSGIVKTVTQGLASTSTIDYRRGIESGHNPATQGPRDRHICLLPPEHTSRKAHVHPRGRVDATAKARRESKRRLGSGLGCFPREKSQAQPCSIFPASNQAFQI